MERHRHLQIVTRSQEKNSLKFDGYLFQISHCFIDGWDKSFWSSDDFLVLLDKIGYQFTRGNIKYCRIIREILSTDSVNGQYFAWLAHNLTFYVNFWTNRFLEKETRLKVTLELSQTYEVNSSTDLIRIKNINIHFSTKKWIWYLALHFTLK